MTTCSQIAAGAALSEAAARDLAPLEIALRHYYYKPMAAFFRSFELRAYLAAETRLTPPALDLGCGDGTFGTMLAEALGTNVRFTGVDPDRRAVLKGQRRSGARYERLLCASSESLPFDTGEVRTIIANGSLGCGAGTDRGLAEIGRVLAPGGVLYCTVPTPHFERNYWLVRALARLRLERSARVYAARMNRRMTHVCCLGPEGWRTRLEAHGLAVERTIGFFPAHLVTPWSILAANPLRVMGLIGVPPLKFLTPAARAVERRLFQRLYRETPAQSAADGCAYILIRAVRVTGMTPVNG